MPTHPQISEDSPALPSQKQDIIPQKNNLLPQKNDDTLLSNLTQPTQIEMIRIGTIIDQRWQCISLLGQGGFGVVYQALDLKIEHRVVAIKILTLDPEKYPQIIRRFKQEASVTSRLRSPHTLTIFDYGEWKSFYYIVSELLIGETLSDLLEREQRLPVLKSLHILMDVCESLREAHGQNIIHRDIKPDNLFLNRTHSDQSIVKLIDFGIAQLRAANVSYLTAPMSVMGTPHYMSPEQAQDSADVDPRSDIYSLGIVLYHCLTGAPPFQGSNLYQIIRQHVEKEIPKIQFDLLDSGIAHNINQILKKMTQKKREDRYSSVDVLMKDLGIVIKNIERLSQDDEIQVLPQRSIAQDSAFSNENNNHLDHDEDFKIFQSGLSEKAPTIQSNSTAPQDQEWFKTYISSDESSHSHHQASSKNSDLILFLISLLICGVVLYFMHQAGVF